MQLLRRQALRHIRAAYRSSLPDRLDGLVGRRVIPDKSFLGAVERDHHDAPWWLALESLSLARTVNKLERTEAKEHMMVRSDEEDPSGAPVSVRDRDGESAASATQ